jgi:uncharacterized protein (TIGR00251 family)
MIEISESDGWVEFTVRVIPRASRSEVVGEFDGALKVKVSAPPVDGAANAEIQKLIAKRLGVSRSAVQIVSGESSKTKRLRVSGVTAAQVLEALGIAIT